METTKKKTGSVTVLDPEQGNLWVTGNGYKSPVCLSEPLRAIGTPNAVITVQINLEPDDATSGGPRQFAIKRTTARGNEREFIWVVKSLVPFRASNGDVGDTMLLREERGLLNFIRRPFLEDSAGQEAESNPFAGQKVWWPVIRVLPNGNSDLVFQSSDGEPVVVEDRFFAGVFGVLGRAEHAANISVVSSAKTPGNHLMMRRRRFAENKALGRPACEGAEFTSWMGDWNPQRNSWKKGTPIQRLPVARANPKLFWDSHAPLAEVLLRWGGTVGDFSKMALSRGGRWTPDMLAHARKRARTGPETPAAGQTEVSGGANSNTSSEASNITGTKPTSVSESVQA